MKKILSASAIISFIFLNQVLAYVPPPPAPDYKSCQVVGGVLDLACKKRLDQEYQAGVRASAMANQLTIDANNNIIKPATPTYTTCTTDADGNTDYACQSQNARLQQDYNQKINIYNIATAQQNAIPAQTDANAAARVSASATEQLAQAEKQALGGQKEQSGISTVANIASIGFGVAFAVSCVPTGANCYWPYAYASAAAAVVSMITGSQANQDAKTAFSACQSYNQIASATKPCGAPVTSDPNKPSFPYSQVDAKTGQCLASAPDTCKKNLDDLNSKGVDVRKVIAGGPSGFAGPNTPFTLNDDGSVTMKDGKKFSAADFADEKSMIEAGIPAAEAAKIAAQLYGKDGVLAKAGFDPKADLNALSKGGFGAFDSGTSSTTTVKIGGDEGGKSGLGTKDPSAGKKRDPAGQGLVKDFNGDSIGIANDDIFKMMNKRYILKSAQDSFIGQ